MSEQQVSLLFTGEFIATATLTTRHPDPNKSKRKQKEARETQLELFGAEEFVADALARKAYMTWLKQSLREYPHLTEKIERLERMATGAAEGKIDTKLEPTPRKVRYPAIVHPTYPPPDSPPHLAVDKP